MDTGPWAMDTSCLSSHSAGVYAAQRVMHHSHSLPALQREAWWTQETWRDNRRLHTWEPAQLAPRCSRWLYLCHVTRWRSQRNEGTFLIPRAMCVNPLTVPDPWGPKSTPGTCGCPLPSKGISTIWPWSFRAWGPPRECEAEAAKRCEVLNDG